MNNVLRQLTYLFLLFSLPVSGQQDQLDHSFSEDGKIILNPNPTGASFATCTAVQPDGKIVVGGVTWAADGGNDFLLLRYHADGQIDSTFGINGIVITDLGSKYDWLNAIAIQPDGKIIGSGRSQMGTPLKFVFTVVRYNANGTLDESFGTQGVKKTGLSESDSPTSMVVQPDGKIIVAGYVRFGTEDQLGFVRYHTNGTLDLSFSLDGKLTHDLGFFGSRVHAIAIQPDGRIVATGYSRMDNSGNNYKFFVSRYFAEGNLDNSFGINGVMHDVFASTGSDSAPTAVQLCSNNKILIGGGTYDAWWSMVMLYPNGTIDSTFGTQGKVNTPFPGESGSIKYLLIQPDDKIVGVGSSYLAATDDTKFAVVRYHSNGTLDTSFGIGGLQINTMLDDGSKDSGAAGALQSDGAIIVVGKVLTTRQHVGIARYLPSLNVGVVNFNTPISATLVYPNPIAETATLQYSLTWAETVSIQLFDKQGKLISILQSPQLQEAGDHSVRFILPPGLPTGSYVLSIQSPTGRVGVQVIR